MVIRHRFYLFPDLALIVDFYFPESIKYQNAAAQGAGRISMSMESDPDTVPQSREWYASLMLKSLTIDNKQLCLDCFDLLIAFPNFIEKFAGIPMNFARTEVYQGTPLEKQLKESSRLLGDCLSYDYKISDNLTQFYFQIVG